MMMLLNLIFSASLGHAASCDAGLKAYSETVFPKVRNTCVKCHDGSRADAPPFAVDDPEKSYETVLNYMNFGKIEDSLFTYRAGNGHCANENCDVEVGVDMLERAKTWWDQGENSCLRNGKFFSAETKIPKALPPEAGGFKTIFFDLSPISEELKDTKLALDIQEYIKPREKVRGAYRIKSPRFIGGTGSIYLKNLKILLNGKYDSIYNIYTVVDKTTSFVPVEIGMFRSATPVISSSPLIILKDGLENPKLQVSFMEIQKGAEMACNKDAIFVNDVLPALNALNCVECHNSSLDLFGSQVFDLTHPTEQICLSATGLIEKSFPSASALISYPTKGLFGHPQLDAKQRTQFAKLIKDWVQ
jgi:hypothetical protein